MPTDAEVEERRLRAVHRYDILDTPPDGAFDRVASLAARIFDAPIATVTIVDEDRVWFKAAHGLAGVTQIGRDPGLCASVVLNDDDVYIVGDAINDPRTITHPLVLGELGLRFYAAAPIRSADGFRLGTVNVIDREPREVTREQADALADLAAVVADLLDLRLSALKVLRAEREARERAEETAGQLQRLADQARTAGEASARCAVGLTGSRACDRAGEVRIADSSGESAWTCAYHAEQALLSTSGVFLADPHSTAVSRFLSRSEAQAEACLSIVREL